MKLGSLLWKEYLRELETHFGDVAVFCRHEIYFLHRRKNGLTRALAAIGALIRDIVIIVFRFRGEDIPGNVQVIAIATLNGSSGYGSLVVPLAIAKQYSCAVLIAHPRVQIERQKTYRLKAAGLLSLLSAVKCGGLMLFRCSPNLDRIVVAATVTRSQFWCASWRKSLSGLSNPIVLLHNDFDMMSASAVAAAPNSAICVQHGIPTDEFFPLHAHTQIVWGQTSHCVYASYADNKILLEDSLGRDLIDGGYDREYFPQELSEILLISQTHTPVYGIDLRSALEELAESLIKLGAPLRILLHPNESRYPGLYSNVRPYTKPEKSPHACLTSSEKPALVIGYASTALIDAARVGHFVAGLKWPVKMSIGAFTVASPVHKCTDARDVLNLFSELNNAPLDRERYIFEQRQWLAQTFCKTGRFEAEMRHRLSADSGRRYV